MKTRFALLIFALLMISIAGASCSSGNQIGGSSKNCGCGLHKGMVGY
jgi:hypothetical protein